jgi:hypothetical protein
MFHRSRLTRELEKRRNFDSGIHNILDDYSIPRAMESIEQDLKLVNEELDDIENALTDNDPVSKNNQKGEFKKIVSDWAESENFKIGESVPSSKILKFIKTNSQKFPKISDGSVRSTLSRLGYSEEKGNSET